MVVLLPCRLPPPAAGARLITSCRLTAIDAAAASTVTPQKPASGWSRRYGAIAVAQPHHWLGRQRDPRSLTWGFS